MNIPFRQLYGSFATENLRILHLHEKNELYWKLRIAEMINSPRNNITLDNTFDIYVYDDLLPGIDTWKDYYNFLINVMYDMTHNTKN